MVLVDYIGIFFYMRQYFWPHTVHIVTEKLTVIYTILSFVHVWKSYNYINQEVGLSYK